MTVLKINRENIGVHLMDYQLMLIDKTRIDLLNDDKWKSHWKITLEQHTQLHGYAISLIKKVFHCNKRKAEETFKWFELQFGLKIKN